MAVFVTGDIHGNPVRLSKDSFYEQKDFSGKYMYRILINSVMIACTQMV